MLIIFPTLEQIGLCFIWGFAFLWTICGYRILYMEVFNLCMCVFLLVKLDGLVSIFNKTNYVLDI